MKRYYKHTWTLIEDKTEYHWMRFTRNKVLIIFDKIKTNSGSVVWDGECAFDENVDWEELVEIGNTYLFPGDGNEVILLDKTKLLKGTQKFHHWKYGNYSYTSWKDLIVYAKVKRYNAKQRYDSKYKEKRD